MIRRNGAILALLTLLNALNYLDRTVLASVLPRIQESLHVAGQGSLPISDNYAGFLGTTFLVGYFISSPIFGVLERRVPRMWLMAAGIGVWSLATIGSGLARDYADLIVARAFVGVGEASFVTLAPTVIDDIAPLARRGMWLGIFYVAMPVGGSIGYILGGTVEHAYGWRAAFYLAGGPGLMLAIMLLLVHDAKRLAPVNTGESFAHLTRVLRFPTFRNVVLGYSAYTFALGALSFWLPTFVYKRFGLPLKEANIKLGAISVVTGILASLIGGFWSDRATRRALRSLPPLEEATRERDQSLIDRVTVHVNLRICVIASALGAPLAAACFLSGSASAFFVLAFLCECALFLLNSPVTVASLRSVPPPLRAAAMAVTVFSIHALGDLWSPWILGAVSDHVRIDRAMLLLPPAIGLSAIIWVWAAKPGAAEDPPAAA